jgi:hypothetical protein
MVRITGYIDDFDAQSITLIIDSGLRVFKRRFGAASRELVDRIMQRKMLGDQLTLVTESREASNVIVGWWEDLPERAG